MQRRNLEKKLKIFKYLYIPSNFAKHYASIVLKWTVAFTFSLTPSHLLPPLSHTRSPLFLPQSLYLCLFPIFSIFFSLSLSGSHSDFPTHYPFSPSAVRALITRQAVVGAHLKLLIRLLQHQHALCVLLRSFVFFLGPGCSFLFLLHFMQAYGSAKNAVQMRSSPPTKPDCEQSDVRNQA